MGWLVAIVAAVLSLGILNSLDVTIGTKIVVIAIAMGFGYLIGVGVKDSMEDAENERQCKSCDFLGKGKDWGRNEDRCPSCGSSSYTRLE